MYVIFIEYAAIDIHIVENYDNQMANIVLTVKR